MLEHCCGDLLSIQPRALVRLGTNVRPRSQSAFQFLPKVFDIVEVRALCRPLKFFHTDLNKTFLCGTRFVHGACWNRKRLSPTCCHKVGSTESSWMSLYAVALRFPFTGTKGPKPWQTAPDHLFLLHHTWQFALCIRAGSVGIAHDGLRLVCGCLSMETHFHEVPGEQLLCWRCFQRQYGTREGVLQPRTADFYALQHSAVVFCELVWHTTSRLISCCC